jgi:hypothetical protein
LRRSRLRSREPLSVLELPVLGLPVSVSVLVLVL